MSIQARLQHHYAREIEATANDGMFWTQLANASAERGYFDGSFGHRVSCAMARAYDLLALEAERDAIEAQFAD